MIEFVRIEVYKDMKDMSDDDIYCGHEINEEDVNDDDIDEVEDRDR
eukprot:CAMPEP_0197838052 /NCGR_PEP_ID=MMETSP1437-20131217/34117_1 /TAXON_ID=49252 ORGANISM="Eucampia antarctica, Strain CCMP1452" /NCGR_SAMPLE_ID=MMETSP1437 /ASSEMBLY_ACC=CAM_ASM_001096 /LENGTH=45 /DNA_ID= /DNA_START= /DNA_END= /DNA_ORIENTATION=